MLAELTRCTLYGIAGLGLVIECAAGEHDTRTETQVQVFAQAQVADETHVETRQKCTHSCMVNLCLTGNRVRYGYFAIRYAERREVQT